MTWISYYLAIMTPPGSPPKDYEPPSGVVRRWCFKCSGYKPERTHHCKTCKTCVLKMDHHCPWTYNCVGYNNMSHFVRFLIWVDVTAGYGFYRLVLRCIVLYRSRGLPAYLIPFPEILAPVILTPVTFFVVLTVGLLSIRVAMNMLNGITQIESWEEERLASAKRRNLIPRNTVFPYDIDLWTNVLTSWGPAWSWMLPFGGPAGDGVKFLKNESGFDDEGNPINWPPDQREVLRPDNSDETDSPRTSIGSGPVTFAQTSLLGGNAERYMSPRQQQRTYGVLSNRSRSGSAGSESSSDEDTGYPAWRDQITSDADFYKRELFETFEGEKISDFGVDLESEAPRSSRSGRVPSRGRSNHSHHAPQSEEGPDDDLPLAALMAKRRQEKTKLHAM